MMTRFTGTCCSKCSIKKILKQRSFFGDALACCILLKERKELKLKHRFYLCGLFLLRHEFIELSS